MNKTLMAGAWAAVTVWAAPPDLNTALAKAEQAWGRTAQVQSIRYAYLDECKAGKGRSGETDMVTREIRINSACKWDRAYLQTIVTHEVGHLLTGQGHPTPTRKRSVMEAAPCRPAWWMVLDRPRITKADRDRAEQRTNNQ